MKHYVNPTQEKQLVQITIHVDTKDLPVNKNSVEIANKIVEFENSIKTSKNNVVLFSIVSRKDRFNNKVKEENENLKEKCEEHNLQLIQHHNIIPFHHTSSKGLRLNKYRGKKLIRNFTSFIGCG